MYFTWLEEIHTCLLFLPRFHVSEHNHHTPAKEGMISVDGAIGTVILAQAGIGTAGNVSLLCHYICSLFKRHGLRPIEQIINHLAFGKKSFVSLSTILNLPFLLFLELVYPVWGLGSHTRISRMLVPICQDTSSHFSQIRVTHVLPPLSSSALHVLPLVADS